MKENLKKLRDMNKDGVNSQANVVKSVEDEDDVFFATNVEVDKTKWVMNSAASKYICRDQKMFDTLKIDGEFDHFKLRDGGKMKVEGTRSVRMKLHDGVIRTFSNVRFVPSAVVNNVWIRGRSRGNHIRPSFIIRSFAMVKPGWSAGDCVRSWCLWMYCGCWRSC